MKSYPGGLNPYDKYKLFSKKSILFRVNEKSNLLSELQKTKKNAGEIKRKKNKKYSKKIYKDEKDSNQSLNMKNKYLKTYQQHQSNTRKKIFGNILLLKRDKKKYTDDNNNHINSSKRTIGPISLDIRDAFNYQEQKLKNYISSSEGSKDIDFDKNVNVVINPYCIILDKKNAKNNENQMSNGVDKLNNKNQMLTIKSSELKNEPKAKKIMFTSLEKNDIYKKME